MDEGSTRRYAGVGGAGSNYVGSIFGKVDDYVTQTHLAVSRGEITVERAAEILRGLEGLLSKEDREK